MLDSFYSDDIAKTLHAAWDIWRSGGPAMIFLALNCLLLCAVAISLFLRLGGELRWLSNHREAQLEQYLLRSAGLPHKNASERRSELTDNLCARHRRPLLALQVCVTISPLIGLLGTVMGMLTTFGALSSGSGGDKTMAMIAAGISEALITTETGLVIALPGLFFHRALQGLFKRYEHRLKLMEIETAKRIVKTEQASPRQAAIRHIASALLARAREGA